MLDWIGIINLIGVVSALTIAVMGLLFSLSVPFLRKPDRTYIIITFSLLVIYTASDLTSQLSLAFGGEGLTMLSKAAIFSESFFSSVCMPILTMYIVTCAGKRVASDPFVRCNTIIWLVYFILLAATQFTDEIYYFTADNVYQRGALYPLLLTPPLLLMLSNLLCLYVNKGDLTKRQCVAFLCYILITAFCMVIQMMCYGLLMLVLGTAVAAGFMLYFMIREQVYQYVRQQEEITNQRISIMMLEMRPHFIYNILTSIYYLCEQDVKKAQRVTKDFAAYLRMNLKALGKNDTVPFSEDLQHTKAYLGVEMARFEESLHVEYAFDKTPVFRIPTLTLQPIVENAIKHGLDTERDALHIVIRVQQNDEGNTITVEDDGQGFHDSDNDEPHIALNNIRERLKLMCGGSLTIRPRENVGTVVTIFIPE